MNQHFKYHIQGKLRTAKDVSFAQTDIAVCAFMSGKEVGIASVDKDGKYKLSFDGGPTPPALELRLVPGRFRERADESSTLVQAVIPQRFVLDKANGVAYNATVDIHVPLRFIDLLHSVTKTFRIHGEVYCSRLVLPIVPPITSTRALPGVRIDFFQVDQLLLINNTSPQIERLLGSTYTDPNGYYDFKFQFTTNIITLILFGDGKPDIKVRISQFRDGAWRQVWESMIDWDISEDFYKDYTIPEEQVDPVMDSGNKPDTGFLYHLLGLLTIDDQHIVNGYATTQTDDDAVLILAARPILKHQPFCGRLRISGNFGKTDDVKYYKMQVASAVQDKANWVVPPKEAKGWEDLNDPLYNQVWTGDKDNPWLWRMLGPTTLTNVYTNVDNDSNWIERELKITWNSANKPDGYYALRIVPCNEDGSYKDGDFVAYPLPVLRVDNSLPGKPGEGLKVNLPTTSICGALNLPIDPDSYEKINFEVTTDSPAGHILWTRLYGYRGIGSNNSAGETIEKKKDDDKNWEWDAKQFEDFKVNSQTSCRNMAYNFQLAIQGSATDGSTNGYNSYSEDRRVYSNVNLIITDERISDNSK